MIEPKIERGCEEFLKLLEDGMIYLIYDSVWVSPILLVTKKDRMTVIKN